MSLCELLGIEEPEVIEEEVIAKPVTLTPFDFVNSISYNKTDLFGENEDVEKQYNAYIINRAMSFSPDMALIANEMNRFPDIPKRAQFNFMRLTVRKKKRYDKWIKAEQEADDIALIKQYYNYSNEKAKIALSLLLPDQIETIKEKLNTGGIATKQRITKQKKEQNNGK